MTSYVNLILFCLAAFINLKGDRDKIIAPNISGFVAMVVIIVVSLYHMFTEMKWNHFVTVAEKNITAIFTGTRGMVNT